MASDAPDPPNIFDPEVIRCPHAAYRVLIDHHPVSPAPLTGSPIIARYEDVMHCLRHPEIFSSEMGAQMALGNERPMIPQQIDPPDQTRYRKILDPRFSRKRMLELEPGIRTAADRLIDRFIDAGEVEFDTQFAVPLPCNAFLQLMGLPSEDLDLFLDVKDRIIRPHEKADDIAEIPAIRAAAGAQIYEYFGEKIEERRRRPSDDMMGYLVQAEIDGQKLTREEILDICFLFIIAGLDTVTATLGCSMAFLAANPEHRRSLARHPQKVDAVVEELMRWETPVTGVPRLVKQDTQVAGRTIKAGELVLLLLGSANLDPAEFEHADVVDFDRARNRQIAFGGGPHRCLGSHLARMELRAALLAWHARIPEYSIKSGETPTYSLGIREVQYLPLVWKV